MDVNLSLYKLIKTIKSDLDSIETRDQIYLDNFFIGKILHVFLTSKSILMYMFC